MSQLIAPGLARIAARFTQDNEVAVNVFWVVDTTGDVDNITRATAIASEFYTFYETTSGAGSPNRGIKDFESDAHFLVDITVTDFSVVGGASFTISVNEAGTASANSVPMQDAAVITWYTTLSARSGRGRNYISGLTTDSISTDSAAVAPRLASTTVVALGHAANDLLARLNTLSVGLVVNSLADTQAYLVTHFKVGNVWRTQRRRANKLVSTQTVTS